MKNDILTLYSRDGNKMYLVSDKEILEYALSVPFSRDGYDATYIGKQKRTNKLTKTKK